MTQQPPSSPDASDNTSAANLDSVNLNPVNPNSASTASASEDLSGSGNVAPSGSNSEGLSDRSGLQKLLRINSFGLRLFSLIMGGALLSISSMAFLFGETVKYQAEEQIQRTLENKVSSINEVIDQAESLSHGLGVSVSTLRVRGAQTPGTYQELTRQLFQERPEFVTGLGVGQVPFGILPTEEWFFPYYVSAEGAETRYENLATAAEPYAETTAYQQYFSPQQARWTTPYDSDRGVLLTHYSPIFDNRNNWLGTAVVDIDGTYLSQVLNEPIFRQGGELILLTETGEVIAHPSDTDEIGSQTYEDIPDLQQVWNQMSVEKPGFVEGDSGYWSYTHIPEQEWRVLAYVPYSTVFGPIFKITVGATALAALLLAILVSLAIRYLNRRLRPMIQECQRLAEIDGPLSLKLKDKDELEQLSLSFFTLLDQLQLSKSQVEAEAAHAIDAEEKLKQVRAKAVAEQMRQQLTAQDLESRTSAQALESLNHFSHVLDSLNHVSDQVHTLEFAITNAKSDTVQQTELLTQMQSEVETNAQLSQSLAAGLDKMGTAKSDAYKAVTASQQQAAAMAKELSDFQPKIAALIKGMQKMFEATDSVASYTRKHQRIANAVQVVLLNASTLSISASQRRSPEEFATIVQQFQNKETQLAELSEQLQTSREAQQACVDQLQAMIGTFESELSHFDRSVQYFSTVASTSKERLETGQAAVTHLGNQQVSLSESGQQLARLGETIQSTLQEMSVIAQTTQTRLELSSDRTLSMETLTAELTESTAILLKQAEEKYAEEVGWLSSSKSAS